MFIACFWPAWIWCTRQRVARGRHLQFNSIRLSVTEMLGKGSIWFNCESVHDMARCQEKQMQCRMIKSTVSERWTSSTSNGCAAAFVLGTDGRKKTGSVNRQGKSIPKVLHIPSDVQFWGLQPTRYQIVRWGSSSCKCSKPPLWSIATPRFCYTSIPQSCSKHGIIPQQGQTSMSRRCWKSLRTCETSWTIGVWDRRGVLTVSVFVVFSQELAVILILIYWYDWWWSVMIVCCPHCTPHLYTCAVHCILLSYNIIKFCDNRFLRMFPWSPWAGAQWWRLRWSHLAVKCPVRSSSCCQLHCSPHLSAPQIHWVTYYGNLVIEWRRVNLGGEVLEYFKIHWKPFLTSYFDIVWLIN